MRHFCGISQCLLKGGLGRSQQLLHQFRESFRSDSSSPRIRDRCIYVPQCFWVTKLNTNWLSTAEVTFHNFSSLGVDFNSAKRTKQDTEPASYTEGRVNQHCSCFRVSFYGAHGANRLAYGGVALQADHRNVYARCFPLNNVNSRSGWVTRFFMINRAGALADSASRAFFGVHKQYFLHGLANS